MARLPLLLLLLVIGGAAAHGGGKDDDSGDTAPPDLRSESLILVKIWCLILVFAGTFAGGVSPYFLKWNEGFLVLGTQFAGGVFLGTALMHFLSDSNGTFGDLTDVNYPFAFMLASAGYVITMLADCLILMVVIRGRSVRDVEAGRGEVGVQQGKVIGNENGLPNSRTQLLLLPIWKSDPLRVYREAEECFPNFADLESPLDEMGSVCEKSHTRTKLLIT